MAEPNSAVGAAQIHEAVRGTFGLSAEAYTLTQLRYDLRKLKAYGLLQREGRTYCYRLAEKGTKVSTLVYSVPPAHLRPSGKHAVSTSATANIQAARQDRSSLPQKRMLQFRSSSICSLPESI